MVKFFLLMVVISVVIRIGLSLVLPPHWAAVGQLMGTLAFGLCILLSPLRPRYFQYPSVRDQEKVPQDNEQPHGELWTWTVRRVQCMVSRKDRTNTTANLSVVSTMLMLESPFPLRRGLEIPFHTRPVGLAPYPRAVVAVGVRVLGWGGDDASLTIVFQHAP